MKYLFLLFLIPIFMSCATSTKKISSIKNFKSEEYLGKWYEIARLDHSFERGLDFVSASYSIKDDGKIQVLNQGVKPDGTNSTAIGKAYVKDSPDNSGELGVSFFWIFYAKYKIIYLDENYETAIVTSGRKNYLWILSRKSKIQQDKMNELLNFCKSNGFETEKLIFPKHK